MMWREHPYKVVKSAYAAGKWLRLRISAVVIILLVINLSLLPLMNASTKSPDLYTPNYKIEDSVKNGVNCNDIYVIRVNGWKLEDLVTAVSLQGLVNRDAPRLYLIYSNGDEKLAEYSIKKMLGCPIQKMLGLKQLVEKFKKYIRGAVVYDPNLLDTLDLAITLAGLNDAVIIHPSNKNLVESLGIPIIANLQGKYASKIQVYKEVYKLLPETNKSSIAIIYAGAVNMADYAIKHRMAAIGLSPIPSDEEERNLLEKILEDHPGRLAFGFFPKGGAGEHYGVSLLSEHGKTLIVTIYASSLSFTEHLYPLLKSMHPKPPKTFVPVPGSVYATILLSDGDNIAFLQHILLTESWWYNPKRGSIPVGWTINPWTARLAPDILALLRDEATSNDEIVAGVAVAGHMNSVLMPDEALENLSEIIKPIIDKAGIDTILSWDPLGYKGFSHFKTVYNYFYPSYFPEEHGFPGLTLWEGKPIIYTVNVYNYNNYKDTIDNILSSIKKRPLFLALLVNVWSFRSLDNVTDLANYLESKGVQLVGPREMAATVKKYYKLITDPWFNLQENDNPLVNLSINGCKYIYVYSSVSGDLIAITKIDPMLQTSTGPIWASQLNCSMYRGSRKYSFTFKGDGIEVNKTYSVNGPLINVSVSIKGNVAEVLDVALDQLDTIIWPPRGLTLSKGIIGPRYAYIPGHGIVRRSLGPDPYMICHDCSELIVYDSTYPYPKALGIAVKSPSSFDILDAFNTNSNGIGGDADKDGRAEYHAITLRIEATKGKLTYTYVIAPLTHGWTLRMPPMKTENLPTILSPAFQDILHKTGFNEVLSSLYPKPLIVTFTKTTKITVKETKTLTITHQITKVYKTEIVKTKTRREIVTVTPGLLESADFQLIFILLLIIIIIIYIKIKNI